MADSTEKDSPAKKTGTRRFLRAAVISSILTSLLAIPVILLIQRERLGPVDASLVEQAHERWESAQIEDYELEFTVTSRQRDTYRVVVREGEVTQIVLNGRPLRRRHAFQSWGIEGMLETIGRDVDNRRRYQQGERGIDVCNLYLRGRFHQELGYPEKYIRMERGGQAVNPAITWEVIRFTVDNPHREY